jgi:hypothetical protein
MKIVVCIICIISSVLSQAQNNVIVQLRPSFHHQNIQLENTWYHLSVNDSVLFETFKCYISNVAFYKDDLLVFKEKNSYHLVDASNGSTLQISIPLNVSIAFNSLHFNIGIDSATNTAGALDGDLDPEKGMYWTWQSGYINLKLEGKSNICGTRKHEFNFHLGGYMSPYCACQKVQLNIVDMNTIIVEFPIDKFLQKTDLSKQNSIMIPGKEALELSKIIADLLTVQKN